MAKARLVGRIGFTARKDAHAFHLYHRDSGGYSRGEQIRANPHYDNNCALLRRVRRLRNRAELVTAFPAPRHPPLPWDASLEVAFVAPAGATQAEIVADEFFRMFGLDIVLESQCGNAAKAADAAVVWGTQLGAEWLATGIGGERAQCTVIMHDANRQELLPHFPSQDVAAHFGLTRAAEQALRQAGFGPRRGLCADRDMVDTRRCAIALVHPLSVILATAQRRPELRRAG